MLILFSVMVMMLVVIVGVIAEVGVIVIDIGIDGGCCIVDVDGVDDCGVYVCSNVGVGVVVVASSVVVVGGCVSACVDDSVVGVVVT